MPALTSAAPLTLPALLTELLPALEFVHGLGLVHRDLKPENIFLRSGADLDLVLGDFGLVRLVEGSVHLTHGDGTPAYLPPEAEAEEAEVTPAWDWWSLGMICAELAGGRHPFAMAGGQMASPGQIRQHFLAQRPPDLSAVTDERDLLLCRGLLVADRRQRWGAEQVRAWLAGESPALPAAATLAVAPAGGRTVLFAGTDHATAAALAAAFQEHWDEALTQLFQERNGVLVDELKDLLDQEHNSDALAALTDQVLPADVGVRFARLLVKMDPRLQPKVGAVSVTPQGLEEAAWDIVQHPGERGPVSAALRTVRACAVLRSWRTLTGMERGPQIEHAWLELLGAYEQAARASLPADARPDPDLAATWLLLVALDPERRSGELQERVAQATATAAAETEWWTALVGRRDQPAAQVVALLTQGAAEVLGRQVLEKRRMAEEEAGRLRLAAEEERLRAEEAAADRARALQECAGVERYDLASLAGAFQARWPEALAEVLRDPSLRKALRELLVKDDNDRALAALGDLATAHGGTLDPSQSRRGLELLVTMDPALEPRLNGVEITTAGLRRAAEGLTKDSGDAALADALRKIRLLGSALTAWSDLPGCEQGRQVIIAWDQQIATLEDLVHRCVAQAGRQSAPDILSAGSVRLLLTVVDPGQLDRLRGIVSQTSAGPARQVAWWQCLATDPQPPSTVLASVTAQMATELGKQTQVADRLRKEAARRARASGVAWTVAAVLCVAVPWAVSLLMIANGASADNPAYGFLALLDWVVGPLGAVYCAYRANRG